LIHVNKGAVTISLEGLIIKKSSEHIVAAGQYFDHLLMSRFFPDSKIVSIVALEKCQLTTLPNSIYTAFNTQEGSGWTYQKIDKIMTVLIPEHRLRGTRRRM